MLLLSLAHAKNNTHINGKRKFYNYSLSHKFLGHLTPCMKRATHLPIQCWKTIHRFTQKIPNFVVFSTLQMGGGGGGRGCRTSWLLILKDYVEFVRIADLPYGEKKMITFAAKMYISASAIRRPAMVYTINKSRNISKKKRNLCKTFIMEGLGAREA